MQIRQRYECYWGMPMNVNEEMLAGNADVDASYPDANPDATYFNTGYSDTDICIRIMFLYCM